MLYAIYIYISVFSGCWEFTLSTISLKYLSYRKKTFRYMKQSILIYIYLTKIYIYIFDKNFNNRYFITLEITLIHTVDTEDNKYYLNNIMEKVIPKSKTKFLQNFIYMPYIYIYAIYNIYIYMLYIYI